MTALDLAELLRADPTNEPGQFTLDVPDGLQQGRGAWGGVATGAMVSAAQQVQARPELAVRSLSAQLIAPLLVGRATLTAEVLRAGAAVSTIAVRLADDQGSVVGHGVVVLGAPRSGEAIPDGPEWLGVEPPAELAAGPDDVPAIPQGIPGLPGFLAQLEMRPMSSVPYSGGPQEDVLGWVRPAAPLSGVDASVVAALADAWWIAVVPRLTAPRPVGTLSFTLDLPLDPAELATGPDGRLSALLHRGRILAARQGYTVEQRELWTQDGRLVSWNTQTVAVIK